MMKIEDLKVGDILVGNYSGVEYEIIYITPKRNLVISYNKPGNHFEGFVTQSDLSNYTLKPKQVPVYIVTFKTKSGKIDTRKIYTEFILEDFKVFNDVLDILTYNEDYYR